MAAPPGAESPARLFRVRRQPLVYAGPGRELGDPAGVEEVLLGYFGPGGADDRGGDDLWLAARLAVEEANAAGGYRGKPFRLAGAWSESPWQGGIKQLARLVYRDHVWAIIGGIDGPSTHLAEQVATKVQLPVVSPVSTDKTVNLAGVAWMFSCAPGDHLLAPPLCGAIARCAPAPLVLLESDRHDPHVFAVELLKGLAARGTGLAYHFEISAAGAEGVDLADVVERTLGVEPGAVVVVAGPEQSGRLVRRLREGGYRGPIFGSPAMGRRGFAQAAGAAGEGVVFPLVSLAGTGAGGRAWAVFSAAFQKRFGRLPEAAAGQTYDAVRLVIEAIRGAGLNRPRIGDRIRRLSPWQGVGGEIRWDPLGANTRAVRLGTIRGGAIRLVDAE